MEIDHRSNSDDVVIHADEIEREMQSEYDSSLGATMTDAEVACELPELAPMSSRALLTASRHSTDTQYARITVPSHRYTPLRQQWLDIYTPIVQHMQLQIRFNSHKRCIELRVSSVRSLNCITCACMLRLSMHCEWQHRDEHQPLTCADFAHCFTGLDIASMHCAQCLAKIMRFHPRFPVGFRGA